ncbi:MAG: site-2 protease family protein [Candidatus Doudnabacteria bacterium]|nr:site-2 protease family protein [Candidatus Doudnabacteria bacterium]
MILTILIFIIILGILVFVHEFGHFVMARRNGMKVDEFGFGFPPRMFGIQMLKENKITGSSKTETVTVSETDIRTTEGEVVVEKLPILSKKCKKRHQEKNGTLSGGTPVPVVPIKIRTPVRGKQAVLMMMRQSTL